MRPVSHFIILAAALTVGAGGSIAAEFARAQQLADSYTYRTVGVQTQRSSDVFFVKYDTDNDGDLADEQMVLRTRAQLEAEGKTVVLYEDHSVEAVDSNGDGQISRDEWVAEHGAYFGSLDLNNNGVPDDED